MEELSKRIESLESTVNILLHVIQTKNRQIQRELDMINTNIKIAKLEVLVELEKHK